MKCLNCYTTLMSNDRNCPRCGTAAPIPRGTSPLEARAAFDPEARRLLSFQQTNRSLLLLLASLALGVGSAWAFYDSRSLPKHATPVTEADLLRINKPEALPDWISYHSNRRLDTGVETINSRSRTTTSKFFLLPVKNHWLLTQVPPDHHSSTFEGNLVPLDESAFSKVQANLPGLVRHILPYQLNARRELQSYAAHRNFLVYLCAALGVMAFLGGAYGLFAGRSSGQRTLPPRPLPSTSPLPEIGGFASLEPLSTPAAVAPPTDATPRRRSRLLRAFVTVVWMIVFFVGSVVVITVVATLRAGGDQQLANQMAADTGKKYGTWMFFGSIALTSTLGLLGWLPGTRRWKK